MTGAGTPSAGPRPLPTEPGCMRVRTQVGTLAGRAPCWDGGQERPWWQVTGKDSGVLLTALHRPPPFPCSTCFTQARGLGAGGAAALETHKWGTFQGLQAGPTAGAADGPRFCVSKKRGGAAHPLSAPCPLARAEVLPASPPRSLRIRVARSPPPVHFLQLRLLLAGELLQLQPLAGPQLGQLSPDLPGLLLRGRQPVSKLLADHLGQAAPLSSQLLVHLGRHGEGVSRPAGVGGAPSPGPGPVHSPPSPRPAPSPSAAPGPAGARSPPRPPRGAPSAPRTVPGASAPTAPAPRALSRTCPGRA